MAGVLEMSCGKSLDMSADNISKIDDFEGAFDIASKLDVNLEGLETIEEMKERLSMELEKLQPDFVNFKDKICHGMKDLKRDDENKRRNLQEMLVKTMSKLTSTENEASIIEESLRTEGIVENLQNEFSARLETMKSGGCCFVVAGETSAGKSHCLNLFLGEEILPSRHAPCTSVITRISYDKKQHARIVYKDRNKPDEVIENFKCGDIDHVINEENYKKRENTSTIKEVQIYLPSKILQNGLVLVDTPGIGENEDMDKVIEQFVDDNQVMGFIYIIKSDAGGGVDEDRLIGLMRIILQKEKLKSERTSSRFNPKCAMFICNMWDVVTEPEKVYGHIVQRLGKIWPNFDDSKVLRFSARNAMRETNIDKDYINAEYKQVLNLLSTVYSEALNERIKVTYKWIKAIILRSVHHLKTIVKQLNCSDRRMEADMKEAYGKLERLKNESVSVVTSLKEKIDNTARSICEEFRQYLKTPEIRMAITQWIEPELPDLYNEDDNGKSVRKDWSTLKTEIDERIINRIEDQMEKWDDDNGTISSIESDVVHEIQEKLLGLTSEVTDIEKKLDSSCSSQESTDSYESIRRRSVDRRLVGRDKRQSVVTVYFEKIKISDDTYHLSTIAKTKIFHPIASAVRMMFPRGYSMGNQTHEKLHAYATKRSAKLLKRFTHPDPNKEDPLKVVIEFFMDEARETLARLTKKIPSTIRANENVLKHVNVCKRDSCLNRRLFEEMMKDLEVLKRILADYGAGYIFVDDFKPNELQVLDPNDATGRSSTPFKISNFLSNISSSQINQKVHHCPRALWTVHQKGLLKKEDNEEAVSIKVYLPSCKIEKCYSEIAKLRLLENSHVAEFLGLQHSDAYLPAMVYKQHLYTLQRHLEKGNGKLDIASVLFDISCGLEYIHSNGLVHMELNSNTIMVDKQGRIKLTGCCLPRLADLPDDPEHQVCGDFTYLAPEVLRGGLYIACADVYAFGLLVFEMLFGIPCFLNQRKMSLDLFIQNVNPYIMMDFSDMFATLPDQTRKLVFSCVSESDESRPTVLNLQKQLRNIKIQRHTVDASSLSFERNENKTTFSRY